MTTQHIDIVTISIITLSAGCYHKSKIVSIIKKLHSTRKYWDSNSHISYKWDQNEQNYFISIELAMYNK